MVERILKAPTESDACYLHLKENTGDTGSNDKIQAFKKISEFWKTCIYQQLPNTLKDMSTTVMLY